jgi:DNA-binding response OmpR family regulator
MNKKKILVADDNLAILDAIEQILEAEDYEVETVVDGQTIQEVRKYMPDLVLLDIWMADVDGRDICKHLKSTEATKRIPIIIISADRQTRTIAKESGADDFIIKPFELDDLIAMVKKYTK